MVTDIVAPKAIAARPTTESIWALLATVADPEIPVISVVDLGIVRDVEWRNDRLVVTLTPTYSGCPATDVITADIRAALAGAGVADARIEIRLSPAWTTDWLTESARQRLAQYGIAPPHVRTGAHAGDESGTVRIDASRLLRSHREAIPCPRCGSVRTREISRFGSTPCKAQYQCGECLEPFDYFKPH